MSNNLRQAAQQALEALENAYMVNSWAWVDQKKQVITALQAALSEPEQEPCAMRYDFDGYGYKYIDSGSGSNWQTRIKDAEPLYTAPTPRRPWVGLTVEEIFDCTHHITRIQQDEWVATDDDLCEFADTAAQVLKKKNGYGTWNKPLSKEQIDNICKSFRLGYTDEELVRAIERAHGITGDSNE